MHDVALFFAQCAQSRAVFDSLCALLVVPAAAWIASRLLAPQISRMADDPAWQAPYAAIAASLPGALFLGLALSALARGMGTACWTMPGGRIVFSAIALAALAASARAAWIAIVRTGDLRRLVRGSHPASQRLHDIASACGVRAREVRDDAPVCALAGVLAPVVLVSSGALRALGDDELRAALLHERAHARRGDQLLAACLSFFADLLPLPAHDLIETYERARELAADRAAARIAGRESLARALIGFAKSGRALAGMTPLSGSRGSSVVARVSALLEGEHGRAALGAARAVRRLALGAALALIVVVGIAGPVSAAQRAHACSIAMTGHP